MGLTNGSRGDEPVAQKRTTTFRVLREGGEWVLRRDDQAGAARIEEPEKDFAVRKGLELAEAFKPSQVIVYHESGPPSAFRFYEGFGRSDGEDEATDPDIDASENRELEGIGYYDCPGCGRLFREPLLSSVRTYRVARVHAVGGDEPCRVVVAVHPDGQIEAELISDPLTPGDGSAEYVPEENGRSSRTARPPRPLR